MKIPRRNKLIGLLSLFLALASPAFASEIYEYNQSLQSLGMGGVRILRPNDPGSMLVNPAVLAWNQGFSWDIFDIGTGFNLSAATDAASFSNISASNLSALYGKPLWVGAGGNTTLVFPNFGFSAYTAASTSTILNNPAFPNMDFSYLYDYGFLIGTAFSISDFFSAGVSFKRITRRGGVFNLGPETMASLSSTSLLESAQNEGTGYGFDVGMILQAPTPLRPTLSVGWKDVGSTTFIRSKGTAAPPLIKDNLTIGMTFNTEITGFGLAGGLEYRNVNLSGEQLGKKIHLGLELQLLLATIRTGFYQGYTTYGTTIDFGPFSFNAAMYTVETGVYPGQTGSQRGQGGFNLGIAFNPDLSLADTSSSSRARRKLKQRR